MVEESKAIDKFLDSNHHLHLQATGADHSLSLDFALLGRPEGTYVDSLTVRRVRALNCITGPPFKKGLYSLMHPGTPSQIRGRVTRLVSIISDQWFNPTQPIMVPEMSKFCEHLASFMIDDIADQQYMRRHGIALLFAMVRLPEWRKFIPSKLWSILAYSELVQ